jgi:hypothetical protein
MTAANLTEGAERLIAAEHLLSEHLPEMQLFDRLGLVMKIRDILDGSADMPAEGAA